ncbi:sensor histidine kinase [Tumebacillus permanentifrigoris]|uniref:histidine kinase n=1 Tax=Tumebacillus permanentifrigoris TaxID=378543 RepID=A0A316DDZ0_9BACL|nr:HAMP domain-containing sensor histidine kinase [Tumebacillus permanentifrigoris]PWK15848.1 signal transduction histidine kinase [Tumebacillus permanentifrigoris]
MKRLRIFHKLILVILGIMLVTVLVLNVAGTYLYRGYFLQERQASMLDQARAISIVVGKRMERVERDDPFSSGQDATFNAVYIYNADGTLRVEPPEEKRRTAPPNAAFVEATLTGVEQVPEAKTTQPESMQVGVPIRRGPKVIGAVVVQGAGLDRHFGGVDRVLVISGVIALLCTSLLAFLFSRSIARPLQEMSDAVRRMAKGDFSRKVKVRSQDEVGELAGAFNHMAEELAALEAMRSEFVAHASHELRSPLTSIRGFVGAILDGTIPVEEARPFLERIHKESERLGKLVDELLDLARLENPEQEPLLVEGETSLGFVVREALAMLAPQIETKGLVLHTEYADVTVQAPAERVIQVVINLLSNAIRFSHKGGTITIRVLDTGTEGRVEILDRGIGIPEEEIERVWERFYKVDKARTTDQGGTGLGLSIAKRIVELLGGQIGLDSVWEEGTRAWMSLPKL